MKLDDTLCYCFHVSKRKVVNFIRIQKPRRASQVSECGGAGTGCGWCVAYLKRYFQQMTSGTFTDDDQVTAEDYARQRGKYLESGKGVAPAGAIPPPAQPANGNSDMEHRGA